MLDVFGAGARELIQVSFLNQHNHRSSGQKASYIRDPS
jgi:hypothetical protein